MQYAIELYFNEEMEHMLYDLAGRVAAAGLSTKFLEWQTRSHVTLACFSDVDEAEAADRLKQFAQAHHPIPVYIGSLGMFTDTRTIFASPIMHEGMFQLHRELHERFQGFDAKGWEWYCPNRWAPHCSLALMSEDPEESYYKACDLLLRSFEKVNGLFTRVGLVKISFPVAELYTAEFAK